MTYPQKCVRTYFSETLKGLVPRNVYELFFSDPEVFFLFNDKNYIYRALIEIIKIFHHLVLKPSNLEIFFVIYATLLFVLFLHIQQEDYYGALLCLIY